MRLLHTAAGAGERAGLGEREGGEHPCNSPQTQGTPGALSPLHHTRVAKDARRGILDQEKGTPALNRSFTTNWLCDLSQSLSLSGPQLPHLTVRTVSTFQNAVIGGLKDG